MNQFNLRRAQELRHKVCFWRYCTQAWLISWLPFPPFRRHLPSFKKYHHGNRGWTVITSSSKLSVHTFTDRQWTTVSIFLNRQTEKLFICKFAYFNDKWSKNSTNNRNLSVSYASVAGKFLQSNPIEVYIRKHRQKTIGICSSTCELKNFISATAIVCALYTLCRTKHPSETYQLLTVSFHK